MTGRQQRLERRLRSFVLVLLVIMSTGYFAPGRFSKTAPSLTKRKAHNFMAELAASPETRVLLYHNRRQLVTSQQGPKLEIAWQPMRVVRILGLALEEEIAAVVVSDESSASLAASVLLSESESNIAVDVSAIGESIIMSACEGEGLSFVGARELMVAGSTEAAMDAGRAHALLSWHAKNTFCGACGARTASVEAGAKRICTTCKNRLYPRTDPVAIALVYSTQFPNNEERVLLGRSSKFRPGMYTCLSGFVESVESVEDAVRREVFEEAGIAIDAVSILATQPWPTGRAGACELMIGCFARALSTQVTFLDNELEDARWFSRSQVQAAYDNAIKYANVGATPPEGTVFIPGSYAIAHHLIKRWLDASPCVSSRDTDSILLKDEEQTRALLP